MTTICNLFVDFLQGVLESLTVSTEGEVSERTKKKG